MKRFARLLAATAILVGASAPVLASSVNIVNANTNLAYATPIVTASGAAAVLVAKASPGSQLSVYATNLTATPGFLVGYNAVAAPADGALTPALVLECVPLAAGSVASINDQPGPTTGYSIGITYILTSAATCYTKTTGVITGFIKAKVY